VANRLPGDEIRLDAPGVLPFEASARINPDLDRLTELELVRHGEVVARARPDPADPEQGPAELHLHGTLDFSTSAWVALRARGARTRAHSTAVYVVVAGEPFWNREVLPAALERAEAKLDEVEAVLEVETDNELLQQSAAAIRAEVEDARSRYAALRERAGL
jgi:hypothetical protein